GGQGYRLTSLSVYGDPGNPLYAAVWVQRSGPAWSAIHGVSAADYQAFSATGSRASAIFAAVFEQGVATPWEAHHDMTPADFQNANTAAANAGRYLRSMAIYGTAA